MKSKVIGINMRIRSYLVKSDMYFDREEDEQFALDLFSILPGDVDLDKIESLRLSDLKCDEIPRLRSEKKYFPPGKLKLSLMQMSSRPISNRAFCLRALALAWDSGVDLRAPRFQAIQMALHPRLGGESPLAELGCDLVQMIARMIIKQLRTTTMDGTRNNILKRRRGSPSPADKGSDQIEYHAPISVIDAKRRIQELSSFIVDAVIVDEEANAKLAVSQNLLDIAYDKEREYLVTIKNSEEKVKDLNVEIATQAATINLLRTANDLSEQKIKEYEAERDELLKIRSVLEGARDSFRDPITHEVEGPHFLTTTGHVLSMSGLVGIWINQPSFNGESDFKFQCPLTRQPTSINADPGITMKLARIGDSLGLGTVPKIYFRYSKASHGDDNDPHSWEVFNSVDQLKIMAKFVSTYKLRNMNAANTMVLNNHVIIMECFKQDRITINDDGLEVQMFHVNLIMNYAVRTNANGSVFEGRELQLVVAEGHTDPFADCTFG